MKVCAVVVTYNRKELLLRCIKALVAQSRKVDAIYLVDNASTDGTFDYLMTNLLTGIELSKEGDLTWGIINNVKLYLLKLPENTGGAGGFYNGLKNARELNEYDLFWMMDDDGYPSDHCLEMQMKYVNGYDYIMPVSVDIDDHERLSWPVKLKSGKETRNYAELKASWGEVIDFVFPFNGSLLTTKIVDEVGYPKKELFLWGDEYEHYWRCKKAGFNPVTIANAAFYHPANKLDFESIWFGLYRVPVTNVDWRFICLIRNSTYIYWNYTNKFNIVLKGIIYTYYLLLVKRDIKKLSLYFKSVKDGIKGDFTRHKQYFNKK
ncbi:glycosyltransferase [Mucilaginibacter jinjuensis]|uniref:Glycosyltransferase n=1 Tax=Mucilaginibacter jinjuensis TaxID=1176721 RepID=A0ABY7T9K6_9SPHI|nr:glycosyltransferase [Mucilaginibacter jinjuensis]WCT13169.1 glycosyltransferase [Mucilaginibacter jinjuensis]